MKKSDKTWSISYGLAHLDQKLYRTIPNRTKRFACGSVVVRSWFAVGSLMVLLRYGTVL